MEEIARRWSIKAGEAPGRLDRYLAHQVPHESRSQIQVWIRNGQVLVNGLQAKTGYALRPGDEITLTQQTRPPAEPYPEDIPLTVVYEDSDLAVIEKPAGLVCHIGAGVRSGTLVNALLHHLGPLEGGDPTRPGIVHRLDKQTSGLMVIAKNRETHRILSEQFKGRQVRKEYTVLVYGRPLPASGTIDLPLGRDPKNRKKISPRARHQRSAITHYRVEKNYGPLSLIKVRIETGRTHQIRVHLSHIGHPVVGDTLYGGERSRTLKDERLRKAIGSLQRHFLHAHKLEFRHPGLGRPVSFSAPVPPELAALITQLESCFGVP
jgi:23S rRNA pseudouridine1911/1915/1917 synthase